MEKWSFLNNIYVKNLLGLILVSVLLLWLVLIGLNFYTQHGKAVEVPNVKGLSIEKAAPLFAARHLNFAIVDSVFIKKAVPGNIFETIPPIGSKVKEKRTIYLKIVAFLPQLITIPDVKDSSQRQAMAMLQSLGFENIEIKSVPGVYKDLVMGVESAGISLEAGQRVPANASLLLLVSSGSGGNLFLENPTDSSEMSVEDDWFQ